MAAATFAASQYLTGSDATNQERHPISMKIAALSHETEPDATGRLLAEAKKCKRLAREVLDVVVRDALNELASEFEQEAERLAGQTRARTEL
jgi:hypothetical protein